MLKLIALLLSMPLWIETRQALAQCDGAWTLQLPATAPSARPYHKMVFDSVRNVIVLYGGSSGGNETWEWNGITWAMRTPALSPPSSNDHAMAFDSERGVCVLFVNQTWEWDGTNWSQKSPAATPSPRDGAAMAFDSARNVTVLFGGLGMGGPSNETWEWDGTNWTQKSPATSPTGRYSPALAYDSQREVCVLFGGDFDPGFSAETWEWDGTNWSQKNPVSAPTGRATHSLAYDSFRRRVVLFGGETATGRSAELWDWDGTNWLLKSPVPSPAARQAHQLAYDSLRRNLVLFGGELSGPTFSAETWTYVGAAPSISQQPVDQSGVAGQAVALNVAASGTGELTYQWRREGVPIADGNGVSGAATSQLTIDPTEVADSGSYDCIVRDDCASIISQAGILNVQPPPSACGLCGGGAAVMMPLALTGLIVSRPFLRANRRS